MDQEERVVWACIPGDYRRQLLFFLTRQGGPGGTVRLPDPDPPEKAHRGLFRQGPLVSAFLLEEDQEMAVYSTEGRCMIFHTSALSPKTTRTTQGVNVMSLKPKYRVEKALPLAQTPIRQRRPLPGPLPAHCGSLLREPTGERSR